MLLLIIALRQLSGAGPSQLCLASLYGVPAGEFLGKISWQVVVLIL